MKQVKTIHFSARVASGFASAVVATVRFDDGTTADFADSDALAALLTFALGYSVHQLDDAREVARNVEAMTGKPLPGWITP